jgi:hypothetical protein
VLAGMGIMAWNMIKTFASARAVAPVAVPMPAPAPA